MDFYEAFAHTWGRTGTVDDSLTTTQYNQGWNFIGSRPPRLGEFNKREKLIDQRLKWLYDQLKTAADAHGVTLAGADVGGLLAILQDLTNGIAAITMTNANVTLTPAQYGKPFIVLSGVLTANLNLIFPNLAGSWTVVNNCTGAFTVTAKTAAGTGVLIPSLGQKHIIYGDGTNINEAADRGFLFTPPVIKTLPATLTAADANGLVRLSGSGAVTMPAASAVSNGYTFTLFNTTLTAVTINRAGADQFAVNGGGYVNSITLQPGDTIVIAALSASPWLVIGGTGANRYAGSTIVGASSGYTSVTGSRAIGPIYTNTTGRPLIVSVTIRTQAVAQAGCRLWVGGVEIAQYYTPVDSYVYGYLQGIVPPGATYQVTQATGTNALSLWQEL